MTVARAYVQLGYGFAEKDVADAQLKRANASYTLVKQRVAAGIDNQMQVKQAEAEVASAEQQVAVADEAIDSGRIALAVLLGKGPDRGLDIARPQALKPAALELPPSLTADLIGRRADLVAARWRVEAATKNIAAVKTEFLPNLSLSAFAGLTSSSADNLFSLPARFYMVLHIQISAQHRAVEAARNAWDLSQQRYKAGIGSYLDSLSVQQQLLTAEQRLAALDAQQVDTSVRLVQALGGGFDASGDVPPIASATP